MLFRLFALALPCLAANIACAQADYPNRVVKVIVPVAAGSAPDQLSRIFGNHLQGKWGQPVIIENRIGGSQNIGAEVFSRAAPDGYTLFSAPSPPFSLNQHLFPNLPFDPTAFAPLTVIGEAPIVLVTRGGLGVRDLAALIALAKARPGALNYGSTGKGSTSHLSAEAFKNRAGIDWVHVPFSNMAPLITELTAGRVDLAFLNLADIFPHISSGALKALAVGSPTPNVEFPDVPPIAKTLPGFAAMAWFAVAAPPNTPAPLIDKIAGAIREAFQQPEAMQMLKNMRATPVLNSPAEAAAMIKADSARWKEVIVANGIKAD